MLDGYWHLWGEARRRAKAEFEAALAARPPALPVRNAYNGPHSTREEPDAVVYTRGKHTHRYVGNREFARLACAAGIPPEVMNCEIVEDGGWFRVTSPRGSTVLFDRAGSALSTRIAYRLLAQSDVRTKNA